jgi:solute carrier family 29 (equilibrative nucleoside transporter), member 1/2/3
MLQVFVLTGRLQISPSNQTRSSIIWLIILNFLLTLSTYFVPSPRAFFAFVLFNAAAQATAGAYLQTSTLAVGSLFGPLAIQSIMAGQAAVAVVVSGVQVISSAMSIVGKPHTYIGDGSAEERSAFVFFALSTVFLLVSGGVHTWLIRMPVYKLVAASLERKSKNQDDPVQGEEHQELIPSESVALQSDKSDVIRIAKINIAYEVAVAYVFLVTLVLSD